LYKTFRKIKEINLYLLIPIFILLFIILLYVNYKNNTKIFANTTSYDTNIQINQTKISTKLKEDFTTFNPTIWKEYMGTFKASNCDFVQDNIDISNNQLNLNINSSKQADGKYECSQYGTKLNINPYGRYSGEVKPISKSGIITALFLYRENPKQEIDIEFLGKDTTKVQFNVFYNPGKEGETNNNPIQYPFIYNLGFDASMNFHKYGIIWLPTSIKFLVDNTVVYTFKDQSFIPNLPMQFTLNDWIINPNDKQLVNWGGELDINTLPQSASYKNILIEEFQYLSK